MKINQSKLLFNQSSLHDGINNSIGSLKSHIAYGYKLQVNNSVSTIAVYEVPATLEDYFTDNYSIYISRKILNYDTTYVNDTSLLSKNAYWAYDNLAYVNYYGRTIAIREHVPIYTPRAHFTDAEYFPYSTFDFDNYNHVELLAAKNAMSTSYLKVYDDYIVILNLHTITIVDKATNEVVKRHYLGYTRNEKSLISPWRILQRVGNYILIETSQGLLIYDLSTLSFTHILPGLNVIDCAPAYAETQVVLLVRNAEYGNMIDLMLIDAADYGAIIDSYTVPEQDLSMMSLVRWGPFVQLYGYNSTKNVLYIFSTTLNKLTLAETYTDNPFIDFLRARNLHLVDIVEVKNDDLSLYYALTITYDVYSSSNSIDKQVLVIYKLEVSNIHLGIVSPIQTPVAQFPILSKILYEITENKYEYKYSLAYTGVLNQDIHTVSINHFVVGNTIVFTDNKGTVYFFDGINAYFVDTLYDVESPTTFVGVDIDLDTQEIYIAYKNTLYKRKVKFDLDTLNSVSVDIDIDANGDTYFEHSYDFLANDFSSSISYPSVCLLGSEACVLRSGGTAIMISTQSNTVKLGALLIAYNDLLDDIGTTIKLYDIHQVHGVYRAALGRAIVYKDDPYIVDLDINDFWFEYYSNITNFTHFDYKYPYALFSADGKLILHNFETDVYTDSPDPGSGDPHPYFIDDERIVNIGYGTSIITIYDYGLNSLDTISVPSTIIKAHYHNGIVLLICDDGTAHVYNIDDNAVYSIGSIGVTDADDIVIADDLTVLYTTDSSSINMYVLRDLESDTPGSQLILWQTFDSTVALLDTTPEGYLIALIDDKIHILAAVIDINNTGGSKFISIGTFDLSDYYNTSGSNKYTFHRFIKGNTYVSINVADNSPATPLPTGPTYGVDECTIVYNALVDSAEYSYVNVGIDAITTESNTAYIYSNKITGNNISFPSISRSSSLVYLQAPNYTVIGSRSYIFAIDITDYSVISSRMPVNIDSNDGALLLSDTSRTMLMTGLTTNLTYAIVDSNAVTRVIDNLFVTKIRHNNQYFSKIAATCNNDDATTYIITGRGLSTFYLEVNANLEFTAVAGLAHSITNNASPDAGGILLWCDGTHIGYDLTTCNVYVYNSSTGFSDVELIYDYYDIHDAESVWVGYTIDSNFGFLSNDGYIVVDPSTGYHIITSSTSNYQRAGRITPPGKSAVVLTTQSYHHLLLLSTGYYDVDSISALHGFRYIYISSGSVFYTLSFTDYYVPVRDAIILVTSTSQAHVIGGEYTPYSAYIHRFTRYLYDILFRYMNSYEIDSLSTLFNLEISVDNEYNISIIRSSDEFNDLEGPFHFVQPYQKSTGTRTIKIPYGIVFSGSGSIAINTPHNVTPAALILPIFTTESGDIDCDDIDSSTYSIRVVNSYELTTHYTPATLVNEVVLNNIDNYLVEQDT